LNPLPRSGLELIFSTSRDGAEAFAWNDAFAAISISTPNARFASLQQRNLIARCDLQFLDLENDPRDGRIVFTAEMAATALRFVARGCADAKLLLVHRDAGISRSTAMANAIGDIFGVAVRHQNHALASPNALVQQLLHDEARRQSKPS
jgi:predicted protein tyrosine phosphatase